MGTLVICVGLPASGKSTWAEKEVLKAKPGQAIRVNRDLIRTMLHADRWAGQKTEKMTVAVRDTAIVLAMAGKTSLIICDDTNLDPKVQEALKGIATRNGYDWLIYDFTDVPLKTCIERDLKRQRSVGKDVIEGMWKKFLAPAPVTYFYTDGLPFAILVDLDGTLAHMCYDPTKGSKRGPFDWSRVGEDSLDTVVSRLVSDFYETGGRVILMSGRDAVCRAETEAWLETYLVSYHELHMRPQGDQRKDSIVKRELYEEHVAGKYNVRFVLDDRNQVIRMWRDDLGLKVLQVADGDF